MLSRGVTVSLNRNKAKYIGPGSEAGGTLPDGVLGLGQDLCAVSRLERELAAPERGFVDAVFLPAELARCMAHPHPARLLAACFAAKEAVIKSLARTGGQGTFWQDIEVGDDAHGHPVVTLHGRLEALAAALGVDRVHVSHTHDRIYGAACAMVTGRSAR